MKELKIETERLFLFPASDDTMREMVVAEKDELMRQAYSEMLQECLATPEKRMWYALWQMELKNATGTIVGNFCFKGLDANGSIEIGYGLRDGFCGNGYMTEAIKAVSEWALMQENVIVIEAETTEDNKKSQKVLLNAGFKFSGKYGKEGPRYYLRKDF